MKIPTLNQLHLLHRLSFRLTLRLIMLFMSKLARTTHVILVAASLMLCSQSILAAETSDAELVVVLNTQEAPTLTKQQIRHVFMGGRLSRKYKAINLPSGHPLRIKFNTKIIGLTESRIQSYWAQMKFTGRSKPPMEVNSTEELLNQLLETEGAMAYIPASVQVPEGLTVIYP